MDDFPDVYPAKESPQWATFCPGRRPPFKAHTSKGLAHSAIAYHKPQLEIALYKLEVVSLQSTTTTVSSVYVNTVSTGSPLAFKTQWKKVWEYKFPETCDFCEQKIPPRRHGGPPDVHLPYRYKGRVIDAPVVCRNCYSNQYTETVEEQKRKKDIERLKALKELYPDI